MLKSPIGSEDTLALCINQQLFKEVSPMQSDVTLQCLIKSAAYIF